MATGRGVGALTLAAVGTRAGYRPRDPSPTTSSSRRALVEALACSLQDLVPAVPAGLPEASRLEQRECRDGVYNGLVVLLDVGVAEQDVLALLAQLRGH